MLNVNMDKHPHRINERGMASLETEGRAEERGGGMEHPHRPI